MRKTKALGQHFLTSRPVLKKIIAEISPQKDELVIEIGAGKGALTFPLADSCAKIIAIEKDSTLIPFLLKKKRENMIVLEGDVLKLNFAELLEKEKNFPGRIKLVGNLPYSISSPLLFKILESRDLFPRCVFLLQKEVAERLCARPGTKKYAPLSIFFQLDFDVRLCFKVEPGSFTPPPQVQSALVSFTRRKKSLFPIKDEGLFRRFLKTAFSHRRKTLLNNLKALSLPMVLIRDALERLSLAAKVRAEQISIGDFVRLFDLLWAALRQSPTGRNGRKRSAELF